MHACIVFIFVTHLYSASTYAFHCAGVFLLQVQCSTFFLCSGFAAIVQQEASQMPTYMYGLLRGTTYAVIWLTFVLDSLLVVFS